MCACACVPNRFIRALAGLGIPGANLLQSRPSSFRSVTVIVATGLVACRAFRHIRTSARTRLNRYIVTLYERRPHTFHTFHIHSRCVSLRVIDSIWCTLLRQNWFSYLIFFFLIACDLHIFLPRLKHVTIYPCIHPLVAPRFKRPGWLRLFLSTTICSFALAHVIPECAVGNRHLCSKDQCSSTCMLGKI